MGLARGRWGPVLVRPCRSGGLSWKGRTRTGIAGAIIRGLTRDKYYFKGYRILYFRPLSRYSLGIAIKDIIKTETES